MTAAHLSTLSTHTLNDRRARVIARLSIGVRTMMAIVAILSSLATTAYAQSSETGLRTRVWTGAVGRYVLSDNDPYDAPPFGTVATEVDGSAFGLGADVEYKFFRHLGVDAALGYARLNVDFASSVAPGTDSAKFGVMPLLVALNVHVVSNERVDIWVGPQVGYLFFPDSLTFPVAGAGTFRYTHAHTFSPKGFNVGTDLSFNERYALNLAFRWQNGDGDEQGHLTVDPTFVTAGLTIKF